MGDRKLYISDLHFGHVNVTKMGKDFDKRGFSNLDEMNEYITKKWNANVLSGDHVYIVGDMCYKLDKNDIGHYKELIKNLNGVKHLITGNHDKVSTTSMKSLYAEIIPYKEVIDNAFGEQKRVILSHYYMPFYNHHYHGAILLHGHSHNTAESEMERRITDMLNRQGFPCEIYNVGCMYPYIDYAPRTLEYIIKNYDPKADYTKHKTRDDGFENCIQAILDCKSQNPDLNFWQIIHSAFNNRNIYSVSDKEMTEKLCAMIRNHSEIPDYKRCK